MVLGAVRIHYDDLNPACIYVLQMQFGSLLSWTIPIVEV